MPNQDIDFSLWEQLYERSLTDIEKLEIKQNILTFLKVLEECVRQESGVSESSEVSDSLSRLVDL
jgi:hypothetical protein